MTDPRPDDRLYRLLPAYYRQLDPAVGYPLRDLLRVIARQVAAVEADIARSYDDLFVETCQPWVAPYLGDLVGYESTYDPAGAAADPLLSPRADVANAIAFRRRKGTPGVLADLARAIGRWPAVAVELADRVARFVPVREAAAPTTGPAPIPSPPAPGGFASVRDAAARVRRGTPFDRAARLVDVRRPGSTRTPGRAHPAAVGVFVYRLEATPVVRGTPARVRDRCYTFDPLGRDAPLFARPDPAAGPDDPLGVPAPIPRAAFPAPGRRPDPSFGRLYGEDRSLAVYVHGGPAPEGRRPEALAGAGESDPDLVPAGRVVGADLGNWDRLPDLADDQVAVDPERGRLVLGAGLWARAGTGPVTVSYHHGTADAIGAGGHPWDAVDADADTTVVQFPEPPAKPSPDPRTLIDFVNRQLDPWRAAPPGPPEVLVVELDTSATWDLPAAATIGPVPAGKTLHLRAGRAAGDRAHRPVLRPAGAEPARLTVRLGTRTDGFVGGRVVLQGLVLADVEVTVTRWDPDPPAAPAGPVAAEAGPVERAAEVDLRRMTFATRTRPDPGPPAGPPAGLVVDDLPARVTVRDSVLGPVQVGRGDRAGVPVTLDVADSIWDAGCPDRYALTGPRGCHAPVALTVRRATVRGRLHAHAIDLAEDAILLGRVHVARRQRGEMRYCYYRPAADDRTPRRVQCQPEAAIRRAADCRRAAARRMAAGAAEADRVRRAVPVFDTTDPARPGYFRLAAGTPGFIAAGASDEGEPGAYHRLRQARRAARVRARLGEFTPTGFEAALIFAT